MKAAVESIITTGLADELAFRLERKILEGEFPPGTHLAQDTLCKQFGVSRTPVREALRKLQAQNLIVVIPNKGATVRVAARRELIEVYTVRAELEGFSCEMAAPKLSTGVLAALGEAQSVLEDAVDRFESGRIGADDEASFSLTIHKANEDFHGAIHRAAGNDYLSRLIENMHTLFPKNYLWQSVRVSTGGLRELNIGEHRRIYDALASGDAAGARRAMREHVVHAGSALHDYLETRGFWM